MADVKWIKIVTDIFDDEKVLLIESMPDADALIVIWFKLLCLAGKNNNSGVFTMNDKIPYTEEMLATIFRRKINTIRLALQTFEQFGMVEIVNGVITIPNWGKHQNLDKLEAKKEYMRVYMQKYRQLQEGKVNCKTNSKSNSKSHVSSLDKEEDKEVYKEELELEKEIKDLPGAKAPDLNIVYGLPLNDKSLFSITEDQFETWQELYPAVDVMQELKKMRGWLDANPTKRKTKHGIMRFINSWLSKQQDAGGSRSVKQPKSSNPFLDMLKEEAHGQNRNEEDPFGL